MKIEALLKSLELPIKYYDSNFDISEKFSDEAEKFIEGLKKIDGKEFKDGNKQKQIKEQFEVLIPIAEKNIQRLLDVFRYYEGADSKNAQEAFDTVMHSLKNSMFISTIDDWNKVDMAQGKCWTQFRITRGNHFYRVRGVNEKREDIENNPDELFHIPLTKKALTNNERFSLAGFPSLYLASMLPLAWQECGYPQRYYYSEYQYIKMSDPQRNCDDELKFLALYSPKEILIRLTTEKYNDFKFWLNTVYRCFMMYPLVLACSFVNHSGKGAYKQEYIIPQMLMQWVQRNKETVQGISYFTCVDTSMMQEEYCAYNIVIPAMEPYDAKKYSQRLRDEFNWTKPAYFEIPLFDSKDNKDNKKLLYEFINKIRNLKKNRLPDLFVRYLDDIEQVCVCLYHLIQSGNNSDMQMVIHTLNLIKFFQRRIKEQSLEKIIENGKNSIVFLPVDDFENISLQLKEIAQEFIAEDSKSYNVARIIDKYYNTIWNECHHESLINIFYRESDSTQKIEDWCREHNLLFMKNIIPDNEKEVDKSTEKLVTPLVQRHNSISIYDERKYEPIDYSKEGFDPSLHGKELLGE